MRQAQVPPSLWMRGIITFLIYTAAGILSVVLGSPEDHIAPMYLAAGFGVSFVLGWGKGMLIPIGLGASAIACFAYWHSPHLSDPSQLAAMAAVPLVGASLQTWVCARLALGNRPLCSLTLERPSDIARFLILAGPLACMVNASLSVPTMVALGLLEPSQGFQAWLSWWTGDTLGVMMGAPIMLTLVGQPAELWRARRTVVGLPLLITTLLLGIAIHQVQRWENARTESLFDNEVKELANSIKLQFNGYLHATQAMHGLVEAANGVSPQQFKQASAYWIESVPGIHDMGWVQSNQGQLQLKLSTQTEGIPPSSMSIIAPALERATKESATIASHGFAINSERKGEHTDVALLRASKHGVIYLTLDIDESLKSIIQERSQHLSSCLVDVTDGLPVFLGGNSECRNDPQIKSRSHQIVLPIDFAGRHWQLVCWSNGPIPMVAGIAWPWIVAIGGVALAAALCALLLVITGHTRRLEEAMEAASHQQAVAEAANKAKTEFLSRMSHELRTPLNAVLGFAQVMDLDRNEPLPPTQAQRLKQIQHAGWHLLDMIDDVLDLSRIDSGTLKLDTQIIALPELTMGAMDNVQELAQQHNIKLLDPEPGPAGWGVKADASRLRQILTNLLSNAIKYNRPGGHVQVLSKMITQEGMPDQIQITVEDNGLGMTDDQLGQLFQPFNRLGRESMSPDGAGIGLVISQHLAQLMDGSLAVSSKADQGSQFSVTLPAVKLPQQKVSPPQRPAQAPVVAQADQPIRHILYVEDNLVNSDVVRSALASRAWIKLSVAPTIEEGLAILHDRVSGPAPDLVLLDVHLPDASGIEFLQLMKANPQTAATPVIMISADATPEQTYAALTAGAYCYLTKPVHLPALLGHVDELLIESTPAV